MKTSDRDDLIIRIDQKVQDSLPRIETHLEKINNHIDDHSQRIVALEVKSKMSKKVITGYISGGVAVVAALWKAYFG